MSLISYRTRYPLLSLAATSTSMSVAKIFSEERHVGVLWKVRTIDSFTKLERNLVEKDKLVYHTNRRPGKDT